LASTGNDESDTSKIFRFNYEKKAGLEDD
jgi:hypothetical protein